MSVLSLLQKVKVQTLSFERHPCKDQDQEVMIHYLNGLALISQENENICDMQKEYLEILINSFGLSDDMLESFIDFAMNPNEKQILDMMQSFMGKEIKYNFILDAMMIAVKDGSFVDVEKEVIRQFGEMFKLTSKEMQDLHKLFELFHAQDGNGLYRYFKRNEYMKVELFQYLLDYYAIDMAYELRENEKKLLEFEFFTPTFEQGSLGNGGTAIMTKPVNHAQFCIYLNSAFMDKHIELDENGKVVGSKSKALLMDLNHSAIAFNDGEFIVNSAEDEDKKVTGVTYVIAEMFIAWASRYKHHNYKLSSLNGNYCVSFESFNTKPNHEFIRVFNCGKYLGIEIFKNVGDGYIHTENGCSNDQRTSINDPRYQTGEVSFRMMKLPKK